MDASHDPAARVAVYWLSAFDAALSRGDEAALSELFLDDVHWRNLGGLSWEVATFSGRDAGRELARRAGEAGAAGFALDAGTLAPRRGRLAGRDVIEAVFRYDSAAGPGRGVVRLVDQAREPKAWTLSTVLDFDRICATRTPAAGRSDGRSDTRPDVLVVGGGHTGLTAAAELQRIGMDVLVVDRMARVGDNWRLRYDGLKLHNRTPINHLRYLPFPEDSPDYIPKDGVADSLERYVAEMDLRFRTRTDFLGATRDEATGRWVARLRHAENGDSEIRPRHIVIATSVSGTPNLPRIPTIEAFDGPVLHSSEFSDPREWRGRPVVVMGTGTSAHDICQQLHAAGARPMMVQRSPTMIVNIDPSAQLYDGMYLGDGPPLEVRDLLNSSVPYPVVKTVHQQITRRVKELDAPLLSRLEKVGFRLEFGEDDTGWPLKYRQRGGGYYFNAGCSDLIADGEVGLIQAADIARFVADGLELSDGSRLPADLVVLATGYKGLGHEIGRLFGDEVARRVGPVWGLDPRTHELRNLWTRTGQPGLWFTAGSFSQARIYSRLLALQIDAVETGCAGARRPGVQAAD